MMIEVWLAWVLRVGAGVLAIQAHRVPVSPTRAMAYAAAAVHHGARAGVDPFELVAIARDESDFSEHSRGPDGKDCGLTQTRTTVSRYSCKRLMDSYQLAFAEAARELSEYAAACRGRPDFDRCRLNWYNSGARYARHGEAGRYYLRIQCFAEAARVGADVGNACRKVRSPEDIGALLARSPRPFAPPAEQRAAEGAEEAATRGDQRAAIYRISSAWPSAW